jgi:hypothetical protein
MFSICEGIQNNNKRADKIIISHMCIITRAGTLVERSYVKYLCCRSINLPSSYVTSRLWGCLQKKITGIIAFASVLQTHFLGHKLRFITFYLHELLRAFEMTCSSSIACIT